MCVHTSITAAEIRLLEGAPPIPGRLGSEGGWLPLLGPESLA